MGFELSKFDNYKEDNRREVKKAAGGLPSSIWETYSAFANTYGGVIILGVTENKDGFWSTSGLKDVDKLLKDFWNQIHSDKVNINLLSDKDVEVYNYKGDDIIVINVPKATREQKPIYINNDLFKGTYRRNHDGDYHCTKGEVRAMLRDEANDTMDMKIIENMDINDLNKETVKSYRNLHAALHPNHVWEKLTDEEYLTKIGAMDKSNNDGKLHLTGAGLLMFGDENRIVREYNEYFLDYREMLDPVIRWTDRLQSSSGDWSGNLFDFYYTVSNKLTKDLKIPFKLEGMTRIDDTPVHKAIREALANCLINADFYIERGVVILKDKDKITLQNPGSIRTGKEQMIKGGISDPRNKGLMKMFNMVAVGERAGSGVPSIFDVWDSQGWKEPTIEEQFCPDRTVLTLVFSKKQAIKTSGKKQAVKTSGKKQAVKTIQNIEKIKLFLGENGESSINDLAELVGLSTQRTRALLSEIEEVETTGTDKTRKYRLK